MATRTVSLHLVTIHDEEGQVVCTLSLWLIQIRTDMYDTLCRRKISYSTKENCEIFMIEISTNMLLKKVGIKLLYNDTMTHLPMLEWGSTTLALQAEEEERQLPYLPLRLMYSGEQNDTNNQFSLFNAWDSINVLPRGPVQDINI